jgi:hypothetical protein
MIRFALAIALLTACDSTGSAGDTCSTGSDCPTDLECLDIGEYTTPTTCVEQAKECTISCTTDSDCSKLGNFKCFQGCGAFKRCGAS